MIIEAASKPSKKIKQFIVFVKQNSKIQIPDKELSALAKKAVKSDIFSGKYEEILPIFRDGKIALLVGLGDSPSELSIRKLGKLVKTALMRKPMSPNKAVYITPHEDTQNSIRSLVLGAKLGLYKWDKYITKNGDYVDYSAYKIVIHTKQSRFLNEEAIIADGVNLARNLGNENADVCDSVFLEKQIREILKGDSRCKIEILNREELKDKGLNLHLAVNRGSEKEPKLIIITYTGKSGDNKEPYIALIGKGLTFDSGGLNIKPTGSMEDMRMDMSGAAAVIGTLKNALSLNIPCNAYFVVGLAENAIGPKSYKPGDVLISYCGKTVEIGNTDAEGRLVLADANSYIAKNYQPQAIINIATLTGAVLFALGHDHTGLMSTDDSLAGELLDAATITDDRAWRLPIYAELKDHVKSDIADIKNTGQPRQAGTIAAGEFLRQFAQFDNKEMQWAHLDIAGTAILDKETAFMQAGASGAGVRLLTYFLLRRNTLSL